MSSHRPGSGIGNTVSVSPTITIAHERLSSREGQAQQKDHAEIKISLFNLVKMADPKLATIVQVIDIVAIIII